LSGIAPARVDELLRRASSVRVLVVGDLMLDRYVSGHVERVSPEAPVPVLLVESERSAIGGAGNVAANVTSLGARCAVVGCVGDDEAGAELLAKFAAREVDAGATVRAPGRPTTVKTRVHAGQHQLVRFDREVEDDLEGALADRLADAVRDLVPACDAVVVQDYNKGVLTGRVIEAVLGAADASDRPVVVDPKRRKFFDYGGATVLKPNRRELQDALGDFVRSDDEAWMEATRNRLACRHLLVTLGGQGMALQTAEGCLVRLPAAAQDVYDVSGAGDTVSAVVAVALAAGASIEEAARLANHAAAVEVGRPGVQTVSPAEIAAHARAWPD
jgi:rfaE bifunctional protein kinase chain/domain